MNGFDTSEGYRIEPMDSEAARVGTEERHENDDEEFEVNPALSSTNTDFGGQDPAMEPDQPVYPSERASMEYHDPKPRSERVVY